MTHIPPIPPIRAAVAPVITKLFVDGLTVAADVTGRPRLVYVWCDGPRISSSMRESHPSPLSVTRMAVIVDLLYLHLHLYLDLHLAVKVIATMDVVIQGGIMDAFPMCKET